MTCTEWIVAGAAVSASSGIPGLLFGRRQSFGQWIAVAMNTGGAACGFFGIYEFLNDKAVGELSLPSPLVGSTLTLALDPISVLFLVPLLVVTTFGSIYGLSYWKQADHPENGRRLRLFYGMLSGSMTLLLLARDGLSFLAAWEVMAISAFVLVGTEDDDPKTRQAAWLYLAASHFATLCLFAMFGLVGGTTGTFAFAALKSLPPTVCTAVFVMALLGFGTKAGVMPLHIWLPSAHAMAPSHVSAVLSGVMIKMGVYGLVRVTMLMPTPPLWWGGLLLGLGVLTGVMGIAFANSQQDLKRLLAYSSVENIGIIMMGLGLALVGQALNRVDWILLGLAGALLHVWNHALFKSLLFFCAGSIVHSVETREIDRLGGLAKSMPYTAVCFLVGAVAICGLPPLNGFVSELLIYLGLFRSLGINSALAEAAGNASVVDGGWPAAAFAAPALALIGAMAVACFVKAYAVVFLGSPRTDSATLAHESGTPMLVPMSLLAVGCVGIGVAPSLVLPLFNQAVADWLHAPIASELSIAEYFPIRAIGIFGVLLVSSLLVGVLFLRYRINAGGATRFITWDCGYAAPSARMQYTSSSFSEMLVKLFAWALRPVTSAPRIRDLFPKDARFDSRVDDTVLQSGILPATRGIAWLFGWARYLQQGSIQAYLLYILVVLVALLLWR